MPHAPITVGAAVRIYYDEDTFDEGEVRHIADGQIDVDFYDWIERWTHPGQFGSDHLWLEGKDVLIPIESGTVITDFRS